MGCGFVCNDLISRNGRNILVIKCEMEGRRAIIYFPDSGRRCITTEYVKKKINKTHHRL